MACSKNGLLMSDLSKTYGYGEWNTESDEQGMPRSEAQIEMRNEIELFQKGVGKDERNKFVR